MKIQRLLVAASAWVSPTLAALATFSPSTGINYTVGVPHSTLTSSTHRGDIFMSISFPAKYQYVAMGIGKQMAGSTIFVVYTNGLGNVTVSPREGAGHFEPQLNSSKTVTVLSGSKADANTVVANFKYSASDDLLLDTQSSQSPFIGSWKEGSAFDTTDLAQSIDHHDAHSIYTLDLAGADVGTTANPFLGESETVAPSSGGQGAQVAMPDINLAKRLLKAHGTLMKVAWLAVLPIGAILMRLRLGGVWLHVFVQVLGTSMVIAAFGIGYSLSGTFGLRFNNTHTQFGAAIFGLILVQPFLGIIHHVHYRRESKGTVFGLAHCWYGRAIMILGLVNGGLGMQLARSSRNNMIVYGVIAGIVLVLYLGASAYSLKTNKTEKNVKDKEESSGEELRKV